MGLPCCLCSSCIRAHRPSRTSFFVFFTSQRDAAIAAQVNLHPEDGHSFQVFEAPGPEEVTYYCFTCFSTSSPLLTRMCFAGFQSGCNPIRGWAGCGECQGAGLNHTACQSHTSIVTLSTRSALSTCVENVTSKSWSCNKLLI